eukprot:688935-Prymnesium_polylepis.2
MGLEVVTDRGQVAQVLKGLREAQLENIAPVRLDAREVGYAARDLIKEGRLHRSIEGLHCPALNGRVANDTPRPSVDEPVQFALPIHRDSVPLCVHPRPLSEPHLLLLRVLGKRLTQLVQVQANSGGRHHDRRPQDSAGIASEGALCDSNGRGVPRFAAFLGHQDEAQRVSHAVSRVLELGLRCRQAQCDVKPVETLCARVVRLAAAPDGVVEADRRFLLALPLQHLQRDPRERAGQAAHREPRPQHTADAGALVDVKPTRAAIVAHRQPHGGGWGLSVFAELRVLSAPSGVIADC